MIKCEKSYIKIMAFKSHVDAIRKRIQQLINGLAAETYIVLEEKALTGLTMNQFIKRAQEEYPNLDINIFPSSNKFNLVKICGLEAEVKVCKEALEARIKEMEDSNLNEPEQELNCNFPVVYSESDVTCSLLRG